MADIYTLSEDGKLKTIGTKTIATDIHCDICNQAITASAMCPHIRVVFEYVKTCVICGGLAEFETVEFGFGSIYDGSVICEACTDKYIDPVVTAAIKKCKGAD